ncbi:phosphotransferase enzyme family protein-like protein [Pseudovirgaria hyperparasitica]|uniref:Phosphotransferase enzyme family protein-like protein n=1 Tax=Pseudovirgaria hyperparasitica TaxID=470096 RepID=A0A6A6W4R5_9PEZI|nr:phosphotransferase enzyme family protein-like protein [Pseudovirgaria hyperparasitica]KAF2757169.1 phosphotransferase enzyme family protein-like protein [Pseudovirgaria hyperparasitica]
MTGFDELAETDGDDEFKAWLSKLLDAKQEIVAFVASRRPGRAVGVFDGYLKGSFNLSLVVRFSDGEEDGEGKGAGPKAVIRFPKPGHTATDIRDEKVRNEVQVLQFLSERTSIPVPRVVSWGLLADSPQQLGPFIIMDYVDGVSLATLLKQPTATEQDEVILADAVDDAKLDYVYEQLAAYMLQLSRLDFAAIGAISKCPATNTWHARERPLTYNMNELKTVVSAYPDHDGRPTAPFPTASFFLHFLADEHLIHLRTQRNLADDREDAKKRFVARHRFKQLVPRYCTHDAGPFKLFCDDLQPTNMLADPDSLRITAVLDWEFTNAMPAQFAHDPPWWLLLLGPDMWLERHSMEEFMARYGPRLEQFLRALERVERKGSEEKGVERDGTLPLLSERMRESWATGRFWFDYGIRKSFDVDAVYWAALHKEGDDDDDVLGDESMRAEMERFVDVKMEQLEAYKAECEVRFAS